MDKKKKNKELKEIYNDNNIVENIKKGRLHWVGHAIRSQNSIKRGSDTKSNRKKTFKNTKMKIGRWSQERCRRIVRWNKLEGFSNG